MLVSRLALMACASSLAACASSPDGFDTAYRAHASRYNDAMTAAVHDYSAGRISDAELQSRLRAAGAELTEADAATGRSEQRAATTQSAAPADLAAAPPAPPVQNDNPCFLISCAAPANAPAASALVAQPVKTPAPDVPAAAAPPQAPPAPQNDRCLFISCE
jgi:hypothetical protein